MNISELAQMLADRAEQVALNIFPRGTKSGSEWRVGDLSGDKGDSLGIHLNGTKAGIWCDFATGEAGDLVDLWARTKCNGNLNEALIEIKSYLGVRDDGVVSRKANYERPNKPNAGIPKSKPLEYLESRGFNKSTIAAYKVAANDKQIYFPFLRDGELIMCKWRNIDDKKTAPTSAGQEPCLFGWQAIPNDTRSLFITEGEFDAMAMYQMGYPAVSVPFGGGSGAKQQWIDTEYDNLERFESIYLCLDTDEMGVKATKEIAERLGMERCYWVQLPAKDANDCLQQKLDISRQIKTAKTFDPEVLKTCSQFMDAVEERFYPQEGKEEFVPLPWQKTKGLLELRESELSLWNGMNGSGKSQVTGYIAMRAIQAGRRVCIASMELKPEITIQRMVQQACAVNGGWPSRKYIQAVGKEFDNHLWMINIVGTAKKDELLRTIRYARKRYGIDLFVIDSLMKCGVGEDDYNGQKAFVDELCDMKNEIGCHIAMVTHSRKKESEKEKLGKMDIRGATAIADLADTIVNVWRNKIKEEKLEQVDEDEDLSEIEAYPDVILRCDKQRNGDWEGNVNLWFCKNTHQYLETKDSKPQPLIHDWREEATQ